MHLRLQAAGVAERVVRVQPVFLASTFGSPAPALTNGSEYSALAMWGFSRRWRSPSGVGRRDQHVVGQRRHGVASSRPAFDVCLHQVVGAVPGRRARRGAGGMMTPAPGSSVAEDDWPVDLVPRPRCRPLRRRHRASRRLRLDPP